VNEKKKGAYLLRNRRQLVVGIAEARRRERKLANTPGDFGPNNKRTDAKRADDASHCVYPNVDRRDYIRFSGL